MGGVNFPPRITLGICREMPCPIIKQLIANIPTLRASDLQHGRGWGKMKSSPNRHLNRVPHVLVFCFSGLSPLPSKAVFTIFNDNPLLLVRCFLSLIHFFFLSINVKIHIDFYNYACQACCRSNRTHVPVFPPPAAGVCARKASFLTRKPFKMFRHL